MLFTVISLNPIENLGVDLQHINWPRRSGFAMTIDKYRRAFGNRPANPTMHYRSAKLIDVAQLIEDRIHALAIHIIKAPNLYSHSLQEFPLLQYSGLQE